MRRDVKEVTSRLAMRKLADKYIGRRGEPPSLALRQAASQAQDLTDDDRKHVNWCLDAIGIGIGSKNPRERERAQAGLDFIEALLDREYGLYRNVDRREDENRLVGREDPELYDHMTRRSR